MFTQRNYFIAAVFMISATHLQCSSSALSKNPTVSAAEGTLYLDVYIIPYGDKLDFKTNGQLSEQFIYRIKGDKIYRQANTVSPTDTLINETQLHIDKSTPPYLIDAKSRLVYTFLSKDGHPEVAVDSIKNVAPDFIYTAMLTQPPPKVEVLSKGMAMPHMSDKEDGYFYGTGICNGDTIYFKYTTNRLPVASPLNFFVNGFEQDIITVSLPLKPRPGAPTTHCMVFNIDKVIAEKQPDSLFIIPSKPTITSDVK